MTDTEQLLQALERVEIAVKAAAVRPDHRWIGVDEIAAMLGYTPRYVGERIACRPGFPVAFRLDGKGTPRWRFDEVQHWIEDQRARASRRSARRSDGSRSADS